MRDRQNAANQRSGPTLIDILIVVGCLVFLIVLLYPGVPRKMAKASQTKCASNMHQLGLALIAYAEDHDGQPPVTARTILAPRHFVLSGIGWAGQIYPYVKSTKVYLCPDDLTESDAAHARFPVSYAVNDNLALASSLTEPSKTVLLFEVLADRTTVSLPDEGVARDSNPQVSAAGNGVHEGLMSLTGVGDNSRYFAIYATGKMDNIGDVSKTVYDQYQSLRGRHAGGSNFLAADGHTRWLIGTNVSAGVNALASTNSQSATGCTNLEHGPKDGYECAEGTANGTHALTFSAR